MCPDVSEGEEDYKLKSDYSNQTLRDSVSIQILKCNKNINPNCKSSEDSKRLFKRILFNIYVLGDKVNINSGGFDLPYLSKNAFM